MANKTLHMNQIEKIIELRSKGHSLRKIARLLSISKNTVRKYLVTGKPEQDLGVNSERESILEAKMSKMLKELRKPGVTRALLWEEYKKEHPGGFSYGRFCERIKRFRQVQNATIKLDHRPGNYLQVDFTGKKLHWIDRATGELIACEVLVCTLPFSGYTFSCATTSQGQGDFIQGINEAFLFFGGLPAVLLSDNLKSYVKKANRYEPTFTELCIQFSTHYGIELDATRVGKPRDKGSVERHVSIVYNWIHGPLRNQEFFSLSEINEAIKKQLAKMNGKKFQGRSYSRQEMFDQEEKQYLQELPCELFEIKKSVSAKVQRNYHIVLGEDKHQYSVPYQYIGKQTQVIYTSTTVEIYLATTRITSHRRDLRKYGYTTLPAHMPEKHRKYTETRGWDANYFRNQADRVGPETRWAIDQILTSKQLVEQTYNACLGLIRLKDKYTAARLEKACAKAKTTHRVTYGMVNNILKNGTDKLPEPNQAKLFDIPAHSNIRGASNYQ